jgi:hypothetical protein
MKRRSACVYVACCELAAPAGELSCAVTIGAALMMAHVAYTTIEKIGDRVIGWNLPYRRAGPEIDATSRSR